MREDIPEAELLDGWPGILAILTVVATVVLLVPLLPFAFLMATFGREPVFGGSEAIGNAAILLLLAALCSLVGMIFLARARFGGRQPRLLPAAGGAYTLAAALCAIAIIEIPEATIFGFACLLMALTTPWWRLPRRTVAPLYAALSVVTVPLLWLWWVEFGDSDWICQPVPAAVAARIDAAMIHPGTHVREARAARLKEAPGRWLVAADLHGADRYQGERAMGVWLVREEERPPDGTLQATDVIL